MMLFSLKMKSQSTKVAAAGEIQSHLMKIVLLGIISELSGSMAARGHLLATSNDITNKNNAYDNMNVLMVQRLMRPTGNTSTRYDQHKGALLGQGSNSNNDIAFRGGKIKFESTKETPVIDMKDFLVASDPTWTRVSPEHLTVTVESLGARVPTQLPEIEHQIDIFASQATNVQAKKIKRSYTTSQARGYLAKHRLSPKTDPRTSITTITTTSEFATQQTTSTVNPVQPPHAALYTRQDIMVSSSREEHAKKHLGQSWSSVLQPDMPGQKAVINSSQERHLTSWFSNAAFLVNAIPDKVTGHNTSNLSSLNAPAPGLSTSDDINSCYANCSKRQGVCVMGNDFRLHCVVVSDSCEQFLCVHGDCVATDRRHKCECHPGWVGTFCDTPCTLQCGQNGYCDRLEDNDTVACICHWNYTGYRCQDKRHILNSLIEVASPSRSEMRVWEIAILVTLVVSAVAATCLVLPYALWRRQWIPIRKLFFYFQDYEDDDEKEYDAFISYKSTPRDEMFIVQHLYPKLEQELNFKLCLHFRDFPPGEPIANNIIRAIECSRRTILILSPSFVSSEWCRMEYQKAQHEMLKLKHKIIPIILEDISDMPEVDKNLQNIMDSVTYITWPGDDDSASSKRRAQFWTRLELSMPKRKCEDQRCRNVPPYSANSVVSSASQDDCYRRSRVTDDTSHSGNSLVSSGSQDDSPKSSRVTDDASDSGNTLSSVDNKKLSEDTPELSEDVRDDSIEILSEYGSKVSLVTHNNRQWRQEIVHVNSGGEYTGNETNTEPTLGLAQGTPGHASNGQIPLNGCKTRCALGGCHQHKRTGCEYCRRKVTGVFVSSDDHIVEIREAGTRLNAIRITPRPRQVFV